MTGADAVARRVTHADIARAAGVSRATVSYVLNNVKGKAISSTTQELVRRTAQELGHVPFAPARSLRLGRSNIVLAIVRDFGFGYVSNRVLRRLDAALASRGLLVLVHELDEQLRPSTDVWSLISPTLIVTMGGMVLPDDFVIDSTTTVVRVHGMVPQAEAGAMQVRHLIERGHVVLGYAYPAGESVQLVARERFAGARDAAEASGLPALDVRRIDVEDPASVSRAVDQWWEASPRPTAVVAHNDEIALLVSSALTARGLRIPDDLAVIGIDDIPGARVGLTTVAIDVEAWSEAVVRRVLDALDGAQTPAEAPDYLRLAVRDST